MERQRVAEALGIAIVGTGIMARAHASTIASYHRCTVTGWVSRQPKLAPSLRDVAPAYCDLSEALNDPATEAVLIATPDHAHAAPAIAAAEAGKHILIEKPLAVTAADAYAIRAAALANGVTAMTLFNHRFVPAYWEAKQRIASGTLGEVKLAYARKNDTRYVPEQMISWADRTTPAEFLSCHDLDLLLWYAGARVERVFATAVRGVLDAAGVTTPDAIQAQLRFATGAVATVEACWIYPNTFPTMTDSFIEVVLTDGAIHLDRKREQLEIASGTEFTYPRTSLVNAVGGKPSGAATHAVTHFVDCVLDGVEPLVDMATSVHVTEILEAIQKSCKSEAPVQLKETV
jgi:predicted dehydrogenase